MRTVLAATILAAAAYAGAADAQTPIVGTYVVEGSCPGQGAIYRGTVTITHPSALYLVRWNLASGQSSTGQALEQDGHLAIAYTLDDGGGVMITRPTSTGWEGSWALFGSSVACVERWRRQ